LAGAILAGGAGRRVNGADKGLLDWRGKPLIEHVVARIAPQVDSLVISANRNRDNYAQFGYPVLADRVAGYPGPLAGIAAALAVAPHEWLLCVPVDLPLLPLDLAARLLQAAIAHGTTVAVAHDGQRRQSLCALLKGTLAASASASLARGDGAVWAWQDACGVVEVDFSDQPDAFTNLNSFAPG
jgi:molybdopterin-guanine dinucleotide biosynthesis protein A